MNFKNFNTSQRTFFNHDMGLLLLRITVSIVLFSKHGLEKLLYFSEMQRDFPDPVGVGKTAGLAFALTADAICSILVLVGLFTRAAAALQLMSMIVVFTFLHHFSFAEEHAEIVFLYLAAQLAILCSGAGRFSIDALTKR